jgi:hypothetical protein
LNGEFESPNQDKSPGWLKVLLWWPEKGGLSSKPAKVRSNPTGIDRHKVRRVSCLLPKANNRPDPGSTLGHSVFLLCCDLLKTYGIPRCLKELFDDPGFRSSSLASLLGRHLHPRNSINAIQASSALKLYCPPRLQLSVDGPMAARRRRPHALNSDEASNLALVGATVPNRLPDDA